MRSDSFSQNRRRVQLIWAFISNADLPGVQCPCRTSLRPSEEAVPDCRGRGVFVVGELGC